MGKGIKGELLGKRFNMWTVIAPSKRRCSGNIMWLCRCDCGVEREVKAASLVHNLSKCCGCIKPKRHMDGCKAASNAVFYTYKKNAKKRGYHFAISKEFFLRTTQLPCYYCGSQPASVKRGNFEGGDFTYNGLDRVDNKLGYSGENCVPCCEVCNRAKLARTESEYIIHCYKIVHYQENKDEQ